MCGKILRIGKQKKSGAVFQSFDCMWQTLGQIDFLRPLSNRLQTILSCGKLCNRMKFVPMSWTCKKQTVVSQNSTEAENYPIRRWSTIGRILSLNLQDLATDVLQPLAPSPSSSINPLQNLAKKDPWRDANIIDTQSCSKETTPE